MRKTMIWLILFLLACYTVTALEVSPAKYTLKYEPGMESEQVLRISNEAEIEKTVVVTFEGELSDYFEGPKGIITLGPGEEKQIMFKVKMPSEIKNPGEHETKIIVAEISGGLSEDKKVVMSALTTVISKVFISVPYPDAYLEAKLYISQAKVNETVDFTIPVFNLGSKDVDGQIEIRITDPTGKEVGVVKGDAFHLDTKKDAKFQLNWKAEVDPGIYKATLNIKYNDREFRLEQEFAVGIMLVDVTKIEVLDYKLGQIAKFNIYLMNKWNKDLTNMIAEMQIADSNGKLVGQYTTPQFSLEPAKLTRIESYWDTKDIAPGNYELTLFLHYLDKVFQDNFAIQVREDSIITGFEGAGNVVAVGSSPDNKAAIYVLIGLILVVSNVILWVLYKKNKRARSFEQDKKPPVLK